LQVTYVKEHDRILVRINTRAGEEIRLWLTRALVKNLLPHLSAVAKEIAALTSAQGRAFAKDFGDATAQQAAHDGSDNRALLEFRRQESLQKADFSTPFAGQANSLPLGSEPLLATTAHLNVLDSGKLRMGFEEKISTAENNRQVEMTLENDLLNGLMHLLDMALNQSGWDLTLATANSFKKTSAIDVFAAATPPQYLN
jgi:hypothetical protein